MIFKKKYANDTGKDVPVFSDDLITAFKNYDWPGNVRELENIVQRLIIMVDDKIVEKQHLPDSMKSSVQYNVSLDKTLAEFEREYILNVLSSVNNDKNKAAEILDIDRKTLREKLKP